MVGTLVVHDKDDGRVLLRYPSLCQGVPRLVRHTEWSCSSPIEPTTNAVRLLFHESFHGMALFCIKLSYGARPVGEAITQIANLYAGGHFPIRRDGINTKSLLVAYTRRKMRWRVREENWINEFRLGEPCERVRMTTSVYNSWKRMGWAHTISLKDNVWTVWRVQSSLRQGERLRVMVNARPATKWEHLSVIFRIVAGDGEEK